jgi:methyl-accepting chemotaxis protein
MVVNQNQEMGSTTETSTSRKTTAKSNNGLKAQLQPLVEALKAAKSGNFSVRLTEDSNLGSDLSEVAIAFNEMITSVRDSIQQMAEVASTVASAAEELTAVSGEMTDNASQTSEQATSASASAEQVSQNATTVATAVEEMTASIREIARNSTQGAKIATDAVATAVKTNSTIGKLGQSSLDIGKVVKVITSIAQQTNLLALNATIEAARAGEAGKGFAVVASEVKELAKQTASATEDISQRIEAIQTDTNGAVQAITEITEVVNQINDIQTTIASAVEEQTATTSEISRNVAESAKGATDIAKNIGIVAQNALNTTSGATNTSQAAEELARMAIDLQKIVGKFQF